MRDGNPEPVRLDKSVFVGSGGATPGLLVWTPATGASRQLADFLHDHSVYAIAGSADRSTLAVGTKGGLIRILSAPTSAETNEETTEVTLVQAAPVVALCWIDSSLLAVSDATGRCCVWHWRSSSIRTVLTGTGSVVVSLYGRDGSLLTGLTSSGELLTWRVLDGEIVQCISVPRPPPVGALVSLTHWPGAGVLAWPACDGLLVTYAFEDREARAWAAHQGDFYAVASAGEDLLTFGAEDRQMRRWTKGCQRSVHDVALPAGVVAAAALDDRGERFVLVFANGQAMHCATRDGQLETQSCLSGDGYRAVWSPLEVTRRAPSPDHEAEEAAEIANQLRDEIGRGVDGDHTRQHERLVALGYEHVSLALRAAEARLGEDVVTELTCYAALVRVLPGPKAGRSRLRYAVLLRKVGQFEAAARHVAEVTAVDPELVPEDLADQLARETELVRAETALIELPTPLDTVAAAAVALELPFCGRFLITRYGPWHRPGLLFPARAVAEMYAHIRETGGRDSLPTATSGSCVVVTETALRPTEIVLVDGDRAAPVPGLRFALLIQHDDVQSSCVPVALFVAQDAGHASESPERVHRSQACVRDVMDRSLWAPWFRTVALAMNLAVRRIMTREEAKRRR